MRGSGRVVNYILQYSPSIVSLSRSLRGPRARVALAALAVAAPLPRRARGAAGLCMLALAAPTSDVKMVHNYDHAHPNTEMSSRAVT